MMQNNYEEAAKSITLKKQKLDNDIRDLVEQFEASTGFSLESITVEIHATPYSKNRFGTFSGITTNFKI